MVHIQGSFAQFMVCTLHKCFSRDLLSYPNDEDVSFLEQMETNKGRFREETDKTSIEYVSVGYLDDICRLVQKKTPS